MRPIDINYLRHAWNERPRDPRFFDLAYYAIRQWTKRFSHLLSK